MAIKTFYLLPDVTAAGSTALATMQDGGTPPASTANSSSGWTVGTAVAGRYSSLKKGVKQTSTTFTTTVLPGATIDNSNGNAFRSENTISGQFAATAWNLYFQLVPTVNFSQQDAIIFRVFKSSDPTGATGLTELTAGVVGAGTVTGAAGQPTRESAGTFTPSAVVVLTNEYLFVSVAMKTIVAGGNSASEWVLKNSPSFRVETSDFNPPPPTLSVSGAQSTPAWAQAATAAAAVKIAGSQSTPAWGQSAAATALPTLTLQGAQSTPAWGQSANAQAIVKAAGAQNIPAWQQAATAALGSGPSPDPAAMGFGGAYGAPYGFTSYVAGTATLIVSGAQAIPAWGQSAQSTVSAAIQGAQQIPAWTQNATAKTSNIVDLSGAQQIPAWGQSAAATVLATLAGAQNTPAWVQTAAGTVRVAVNGAQQIPAWTQGATAAAVRTVGGAQQIPDWATVGRAAVIAKAEAAQIIEAWGQSAGAIVLAYAGPSVHIAYVPAAVYQAIVSPAIQVAYVPGAVFRAEVPAVINVATVPAYNNRATVPAENVVAQVEGVT